MARRRRVKKADEVPSDEIDSAQPVGEVREEEAVAAEEIMPLIPAAPDPVTAEVKEVPSAKAGEHVKTKKNKGRAKSPTRYSKFGG